MRKRLPVLLLLLLATTVSFGVTEADAYGKNKVNYEELDWVIHRSEHFEFYYYDEVAPMLPSVVEEYEAAYAFLKELLGIELRQRNPIILYLNSRHLRETNILPFFIPEGVAGFSESIKLRIVMPVDGTQEERRALILHELTHAFQYVLLSDTRFGALFLQTPLWYIEGMAEYISDNYTPIGDAVLRDAVTLNAVPPLTQLRNWSSIPFPYLGYKIGHEAVRFLVETHGWPQFLAFSRELKNTAFAGNVDKAAKETYEVDMEELSRRFQSYLETRTWDYYAKTEDPLQHYGQPLGKGEQEYGNFGPVYSPAGDLIAYLSGKKGRLDLYTASPEPVRRREKFKDFRRLTRRYGIHDYSTVVPEGRPIAWSPTGDALAVFVQKERWRALWIVSAFDGKLLKEYEVRLESAANPSWSPDGRFIAFHAVQQGQQDIFAIDLNSQEIFRLSDDGNVDLNPSWSPDGERVVYASERGTEIDLMLVDVGGDGRPLGVPEVLLAQTGHETSPTWLPEANAILFTGSGEHRVNNLYHHDLDTGATTKLTRVFTLNDNADVSPDGNFVIFQSFRGLSYQIYRMGLQDLLTRAEIRDEEEATPPGRPEPEVYPAQRWTRREEVDLTPEEEQPLHTAEAEPFKMDLPLFRQPFDGEKMPFALQPDESIDAGVAYRTDGTFVTSGAISLSDMLGNHRFRLAAASYGSDQSYYFNYRYLPKRWDLDVFLFREADRFYVNGFREYYREYGGQVTWIYPFDRYFRMEASIFGGSRKYDTFFFPGVEQEYDFFGPGIRFVGDTVRYNFFGPVRGLLYSFGYQHGLEGVGSFSYDRVTVDFRTYLPTFTERLVLAWKVQGVINWGDRRLLSSIGGAGTIRGYEYGQFTGTRLAWTNLEYRTPLVDFMVIPLLGAFAIRGHVFFDAGVAWFEDEEIRLIEEVEGEYIFQDVNASTGLGFRIYTGALTLDFNWAKRTNLQDISTDSYFEFSLNTTF